MVWLRDLLGARVSTRDLDYTKPESRDAWALRSDVSAFAERWVVYYPGSYIVQTDGTFKLQGFGPSWVLWVTPAEHVEMEHPYSVSTFASGWPRRALRSVEWTAHRYQKGQPRSLSSRYYVEQSKWAITFPKQGWFDGVMLPYRPIWDGLVLDLVFWSVICGSGIVLSQRARRRVRYWRGCCSACGYDRAGLAVDTKCPECGEEPCSLSTR